jgi:predicted ATPase/class 3 adenylate cyclase
VETFTFLFTDVESSTIMLRRLGEDVYGQVLAGHHSVIRSALAAHAGREVDTQGDAFFAVFSSPRACLAAVLEMQQAMESRAWPADEHVRVRMGVHCGEAAQTPAGLVGLDVHRAARIAAVANGGQVLVSETAAALVRDVLPPGAVLHDLGLHRLKDLGRPEQIFQLCGSGLQAEFPPLRSLDNPALLNNLPAQPATFIGRERELSQVRALVESARLVTLTGAGGAGKTRLGLQVAADLLDGSGDGVWLVRLAAVTDEDGVAGAIAETLQIATPPDRPAVDTLTDALAPQDILIVLDNCEHLIGACAKVAEAILQRCPKVHLIATSREPLSIAGETIYRVPSLSLPGPGDPDAAAGSCDAVALFADRARAQGVSLALDEMTVLLVASICRRLDGMPLAIELAAARVRSMSLSDLCDRLDDRFALLTGGSRTALPRQQTLRATIGWSYSLLNPAEQALLGRLPVFAGSFGLAAAEAVCGFGDIETFGVPGLLGSLVDKSLVVAEPAGRALRYRLLETIRLFAAERLLQVGGREAAAVKAAHCSHFLAIAEAAAPHLAGPDQGSWRARLRADHANLRRAAEHAAADPAGTALVLRFGVALWRYWTDEEAFALLGPALERPEARADPALFAEALVAAEIAAVWIDPAACGRMGTEAVQIARSLGDDRLLIMSLAVLGQTYFFAGEPDRALALGREAVERARQLGDDVLLALSLLSYLLPTDPAASGPLCAEAIACTERSGDHIFNCSLHDNAGYAALRMGDIPGARAHSEAAIAAGEASGTDHLIALGNLGLVLRAEGNQAGARSEFEKILRISRRRGGNRMMALAVLGLACLAGDRGDWRRAGVLHGISRSFLDRTGSPWEEFEARYCQESIDQARAHLGDAQFDRAYAQGTGLSLDDAVNLALDQARPVLSVHVRQAVAPKPVNDPPQDRRVNVVILQPGWRNPGDF